ncbi:MAG: GAF domain-containing protein [Cyanobacteria bacterium J06554_6]
MTLDVRPSRPGEAVNNGKSDDARELPAVSASGSEIVTDGGNRPMTYRGVRYIKDSEARYAPDKVKPTRRSRLPILQWFYDLPVRNKQVMGLVTSEVISVLGLVGVGSFLIISSGRAQLRQQARAELAVTTIEYDIKINQMGFGFRGQSDNAAIVSAAQTAAAGFVPTERQVNAVIDILQNEIEARNIEYATLVGSDGTIIANANTDRRGEVFDPNGLVSKVFRSGEQIKVSTIVAWEELQKENPPLPNGVNDEDALIRYTVTPVYDEADESLIGALVSGDIVNGKLPIVEETVSAYDSGYAAVYLKDLDGQWQLATSAGWDEGENSLETFEPLDDLTLLDEAVAADGQIITRRLVGQIGEDEGSAYTMATRTITNNQDEPVAVLIRGSSERNLEQLIRNSLQLQFAIAALALLVDIILAQLLGRSIVSPLKRLQRATEAFAAGDRRVRAEVYSRDEVGQVATAFNELANTMAQSEASLIDQSETQTQSAQRARLLADLTSRIRQTLEVGQVLSTSVDGVREVLEVDRVVIYRFNADFQSGTITAESVGRGWLRSKGQTVADPLTPETIARFKTGQVSYVEDVETADLTDCHCSILRELEVKANMVAPILVGEELVGLVCAHQCSGPRRWTQEELDLMQQLSTQIGYALGQATLLQQQQQTARRERQLASLITRMRESLDREKIFRTVVQETRTALATDRVVVFLFDNEWKGTITAESVDSDWPAALGAQIKDPCFAERYVEQYRQGRVQKTPDIFKAGLTDCHLNQLNPFKVRANLVAPILADDQLLGLLIAHECKGPRDWTDLDVNFFQQAATQLGFTLEQVDLFNQREQARLEAEALSEERRQRQETLQLQLLNLLEDVEGASEGDLTVRADVTTGEIGTVADFFNSIVENLRQIVTQVKDSAQRVNTALGDNETAIRTLTQDAQQQASQTTQTLTSVEAMTQSITQVADQAQQAAAVAKTASETAADGGSAMDLTVQNILSLRSTVGETAKKVKRLGESSQQISKVVSLINQIAMQTNLLAINAGIEAARAGEDGQGFAAVAEEVTELAARSSAATQEIERIVENIQRETSDVVEAIESSTAQVVEGTQQVEAAKHSLTQILEVSQQIDALAQTISEATVSQVDTAQQVSSLMQEIAAVSERTSGSSNELSEALQQTVEVAQELESSMATFRVS